jgi:general secretion pathway protein K
VSPAPSSALATHARPALGSAFALAPSSDSRARHRRPPRDGLGPRKRTSQRERGVALVLTLSAIAILAVVLADMHEATGTSYALATTQRDRLKAEYIARSGINLTRLLVAAEPQVRAAVAPFYRAMIGHAPPQIPVWAYANEILGPFCDYERAQGLIGDTGIDFSAAQGVGDTGGRCELISFAENSKLNLSSPLHMQGDRARLNVGQQVFAMIGGYQSPSPYDPIFDRRDPDGLITSRLDVISSLIDWWDPDTQRTAFDPGAATVNSNAGAEDDVYSSFRDPYRIKNAPFDSLEELRYVRGVGDDFWATFVEPDPDDPTSRSVTVYGSGKVNPNEARPEVILARTCSILVDQPLCTDVTEAAKFIQLLNTVRQMAPLPWFENHGQFLEFLRGRGTLYTMLAGFLGADNPLLFRPVTVTGEQDRQFRSVLVFGAAIITVQSTGFVGACDDEANGEANGEERRQVGRCTRVRIRTVLNFDERWSPPPPNAGSMPRMGVVHHWRVD